MMTGRLFVDGKDAYTEWGVFVLEQGYNDLVAMPPLKTFDSNDWQEEDGIEADLSAPVLNTKDVSIQFAYSGLYNRFDDFVNHLADGAYHTFECRSIGRTYSLRMTQMPNLSQAQYLGIFALKFADDYPLKNYTYQAPSSSIAEVRDYTLDDIPFTKYGCRICAGTLDSVKKAADVKTNLLRNIARKSGAIYDGSRVTLKSKDVQLIVHARATTLAALWRNYDALLYDLTRPGERILYVAALEQEFACAYKSCSVKAFYPQDAWLDFELTLTFTRDFRLSADETLLATEDGTLVFTEDEINAIDLMKS